MVNLESSTRLKIIAWGILPTEIQGAGIEFEVRKKTVAAARSFKDGPSRSFDGQSSKMRITNNLSIFDFSMIAFYYTFKTLATQKAPIDKQVTVC